MPAPFVIAHMELSRLLEEAGGGALTGEQRASVFLTNALTGWVPSQGHPNSDLSQGCSRSVRPPKTSSSNGTILVILGNPPYDGYAGIASIEEEPDLTTAYRTPVRNLPAPQGQGLNDLYIRFFRIAERRIASNPDGQGIVSFISNNAWLDGLSHTTMRHLYLNTFQQIFIDNLNGDKYRTGKTTPEGKPDPSAFSTPQNREGIQVGTAIATLVRNTFVPSTGVHLRDLWGASKLSHLQRESKREIEPTYALLQPAPALGNPFGHRVHCIAYTSWPRLTELLPASFPGVKTSRDSFVVDIEKATLAARMQKYLGTGAADAEIQLEFSDVMEPTTGFDPVATRRALQRRGFRLWQIRRYVYRPFDLRWVYWEPETKLLDRKRDEFMGQLWATQPGWRPGRKNRETHLCGAPWSTGWQTTSVMVYPASFLRLLLIY